ncbi:uncharacterized [Tachysurus ichikawai]
MKRKMSPFILLQSQQISFLTSQPIRAESLEAETGTGADNSACPAPDPHCSTSFSLSSSLALLNPSFTPFPPICVYECTSACDGQRRGVWRLRAAVIGELGAWSRLWAGLTSRHSAALRQHVLRSWSRRGAALRRRDAAAAS